MQEKKYTITKNYEITIDKIACGNRLREFGANNFSKVKDFAEALGMSPSSLQSSYFSGRSLPGAPMLAKLSLMGCDLQWLLLGKEADIIENRNINMISTLKKENERLIIKLEEIMRIIKDN